MSGMYQSYAAKRVMTDKVLIEKEKKRGFMINGVSIILPRKRTDSVRRRGHWTESGDDVEERQRNKKGQ